MSGLAVNSDLNPSEYTNIKSNVSGFGFNSRGFAIYPFTSKRGTKAELIESVKKDAVIFSSGDFSIALGKEDIVRILPFLQNFVENESGSMLGDDFASRERHLAVEQEPFQCNLEFENSDDETIVVDN